MNRKEFGIAGERLAEQMLLNQGYCILARNFRCKQGELDLVAEKDGVVHFVEVKTRKKNCNFHPSDAIDKRKIRHMKEAALIWLQHNGERPCCLDLLAIEVEHIENIFWEG